MTSCVEFQKRTTLPALCSLSLRYLYMTQVPLLPAQYRLNLLHFSVRYSATSSYDVTDSQANQQVTAAALVEQMWRRQPKIFAVKSDSEKASTVTFPSSHTLTSSQTSDVTTSPSFLSIKFCQVNPWKHERVSE